MKLPKLSQAIQAERFENSTLHEPTVRLLDPSGRLPRTSLERLTVTTLKGRGPIPLPALVKRVAHEAYLNEIRNGAWVLDIGLFGSRLFTRDVTRELEAGDGVLWEIGEEGNTV